VRFPVGIRSLTVDPFTVQIVRIGYPLVSSCKTIVPALFFFNGLYFPVGIIYGDHGTVFLIGIACTGGGASDPAFIPADRFTPADGIGCYFPVPAKAHAFFTGIGGMPGPFLSFANSDINHDEQQKNYCFGKDPVHLDGVLECIFYLLAVEAL
jgi:hypothetical protein